MANSAKPLKKSGCVPLNLRGNLVFEELKKGGISG